MDSRKVVVFDVDGTLTRKDTFLEFLKFCKGNGFFLACLAVNFPYILLFYLKLLPNYRLKERFFGFFFKGEKEDLVKNWGEKFALGDFPDLFYPSAKTVLEWHRKQGHILIFLTASSSIWLKAWCDREGIYFAGTEFQTKNGRYTGLIQGKNCHGKEKIIRLETLMKSLGLTQIDYAYGDSQADQYFLNLAKNPVAFALTDSFVKEKLPYVYTS